MWRLQRTDTFARTLRRLLKRSPKLASPVAAALELLEVDPFAPALRLHSLHGQLEGLWAARVTHQIRLILVLVKEEQEITLVDVGSHDDVYR